MGARRSRKIEATEQTFKPICRKRRYDTREEAEAAAKRTTTKNYRVQSQRGYMHEYFCTDCEGWHTGHVKPWLMKSPKTQKQKQKRRRRKPC